MSGVQKLSKTAKNTQTDGSEEDFPLITVRWADHWQDEGDFTLEEIKKKATPYIGKWSGRLILETKQMLVLAGNSWEARPDNDEDEETYSEPMYIMKRAIIYRSDRDGS
jgi:hypothetical protein